MQTRIFTLILLFFTCSSWTQIHTDILPNLEGNELLQALQNQYKPPYVLPYDEARDTLMGVVDNYEGYATCIYTTHQVFIPEGADPTTAAYMNNDPNGINTEHAYPQSKFSGGNSPRADLHHLFAVKSPVNTARSNKPFADILDSQVDTWYYQNIEQTNIPSSDIIDNFSEDAFSFFEPREAAKGNIARALFYFYTMYKSEADTEDPNFFSSQVSTLCEWHALDPADQAEIERNWRVAAYQHDLPNPFILDCTLAMRAGYCDDISEYCQTVPVQEVVTAPTFTLSPNPAREQLFINWDNPASEQQAIHIKITNNMGKVLIEQSVNSGNTATISLQNLPDGMLWVQLQSSKQLSTQKLMHFNAE